MKEIEVEVHIGYGGNGYDNHDDFYKDIILVPNAFENGIKKSS